MAISKPKLIALLFTLSWFSTTLASRHQEYQIELVIFSHITPAGIEAEQWPSEIDNDTNEAITLKPISLSSLINYPTQTCLPISAFNLTKEAKLIQKRLNGQILYHQAWRVSRAELSKPLRFAINDSDLSLYSGENNSPARLSGTLTIKLAHYFNTNLQLILAEPSSRIKPYLKPQANPCWHGNLCYFSFQGKTRTRSQVLNYLDHPLYGALIEITHVKIPG